MRRQADESLLCGKDNRDREKAKRQSGALEGQLGPLSTADKSFQPIDFLVNINYVILESYLTCPVEFSMTCTSGILVDIFERLGSCQKGKGAVKQGRFFSVYCAFKTCLIDGRGKFPTDVQC